MSENTASYALVPDLVANLKEYFPQVIPLYFWSTREGSRVGFESMHHKVVKVIGAYARRPKVIRAGDENILVKLNKRLFASAITGGEYGIPIFAGVPLVNSLGDFSLEVRCSWFHIDSTSQIVKDCEFSLPVSGQTSEQAVAEGVSGPLTHSRIAEIVTSSSSELNWKEASEGMRRVKQPEGIHAQSIFWGGYRPFFIIVMSSEQGGIVV